MTAINVIVTRDVAYMLTDTLVYNGDGARIGDRAKVQTMPHALAIIAARGTTLLSNWAMEHANSFRNYDEIVELLPTILRSEYAGLLKKCDRISPNIRKMGLEIILAGWSARADSMRACLFMDRTDLPDFEPQQGHAFACPLIDVAALPSEAGQPHEQLLQIMEIQRADKTAPLVGGKLIETIGGAATLTAVRKEGIAQQIIHRWPDSTKI